MSLKIPSSPIPTVLRAVLSFSGTVRLPRMSTLASEDPLPSVVDINSGGYVLSHGTRLTEVGRETTDDN
jgi:hypothetical protein